MMKKIISFMVAATAIFGSVSCNKELPQGEQVPVGETVVFTATLDGAATKAELNENTMKSEWVVNDEITIHNGNQGYTFRTTDSGESADFKYTGGDFSGDKFMAVYPAVAYNADVVKKTIDTKIPTIQTAKAGSYDPAAVLAVAYTENNVLEFQNAHTLVKFKVATENVTSVTFYGNNSDAISGDVTVTCDETVTVTGTDKSEDGKIYLKPNSNWTSNGARFAAYFFGNGEKWVSMTDSGSDGIYEVEKQVGYPSVIFCRMNPGNTTNNWDNNNKWNQTADLTIPEDNKVLYTVPEDTWDNGEGTWSVYMTMGTYVELRPEGGTFNTDESYYMVVAPNQFTKGFGVELEIDGVKHKVNEYTYLYTFEASKYVDFGTLTYVAPEPEPEDPEVTDNNLYLKPNSNWTSNGARFAAYFFGNGEKWVSMTDSDSDGIYEVEKQVGYPSVIFCRMNPGNTTNNWDNNNKWNQTGDLTIPTNGNNLYTINDGSWNEGTWSKK